MSAIYLPQGLVLFSEPIDDSGGPSVYLSREVDHSERCRVLGFQLTLTSPSTPVGTVAFEGRLDKAATNGGARPWVDLGLDTLALADIDAAADDSILTAIDAIVRGVRLRITVSSGSAAGLEVVVIGKYT